MSNLLVQNIKHTNGTTAQTIDSSGNTTVNNTLKVNTIQDATNSTNAMTISSNGIVQKSVVPHLKVGVGSNHDTGGSSGATIQYSSFSSSHVFDGADTMSAFNTSNYTYTIPANCTGFWHVSASVYSYNSTANQIAIYVDGNRTDSPAIRSESGSHYIITGAMVKKFTTGQAVTMRVFASSNCYVYANNFHTWWEMTFLG